jgi:hypothetical protein
MDKFKQLSMVKAVPLIKHKIAKQFDVNVEGAVDVANALVK